MKTSPFDRVGELAVRDLARRTSRRSLLTKLGGLIVGSSAAMVLPVARPARAEPAPPTEFAREAQSKDPAACNYWRYCAIDGALCSCCGGGVRSCPPGSTPAPTSWLGTCLNPDDGRSYIVAYRDCCGKASCGRCVCNSNDGETPLYRPQTNNDIIWCFGAPTMTYHCSTSVLVGLAE